MTIIFFQIAAQKYPDKAILLTNLIFFIQHETLHFDRFECVDFEYVNSFFLNSSPKILTWSIFGPKFNLFLLT